MEALSDPTFFDERIRIADAVSKLKKLESAPT